MSSRYIFTLFATAFTVALVFLLPGQTLAEQTFEDPAGRFAMDLPEGWEPVPQENENVYVFKADGASIVIGYMKWLVDTEELFSKAVNLMNDSLSEATPEGFIEDMVISGNPARWGVYTGMKEHEDLMVKIYALLGAVSLGDGGIYFQSYLNEDSMNVHGRSVETAFQSIRKAGQSFTGPEDVRTGFLEPSIANTPAEQEKIFSHELITFTLPPGWSQQQMPEDAEKELVGWFRSLRIAGSLLANCHRGFLMSRDKALNAAQESAEKELPGASPMKLRKLEISGQEVPVTVYQGTLGESPMAAVTLTIKTERCWLNLVGTAPFQKEAELEKELIEIAASAK
jgi:hypothetical protein